MRTWASLLLLVALRGEEADARRTEGGTVRVMKERRAPGWQLFLAFNENEARVQLYGDSRPPPGSLFTIVDTEGSVGEVRIDGSSDRFSGCQGLYQGSGTYAAAPRRSFSEAVGVAVGPIERSLPRARLYLKSAVQGDLPHGSATLLGALDLDGNETSDVAVYVYDCQRGPEEPFVQFSLAEVCIDSFSREGTRWRPLRRTRVERCL
jgi:hypothetical protein